MKIGYTQMIYIFIFLCIHMSESFCIAISVWIYDIYIDTCIYVCIYGFNEDTIKDIPTSLSVC